MNRAWALFPKTILFFSENFMGLSVQEMAPLNNDWQPSSCNLIQKYTQMKLLMNSANYTDNNPQLFNRNFVLKNVSIKYILRKRPIIVEKANNCTDNPMLKGTDVSAFYSIS